MGLFSKKAPPSVLERLRPDLDRAVNATPARVSSALVGGDRGIDVLNYLNTNLPADESVSQVARCYGFKDSGCLVLTDRRLIACLRLDDRNEITVLAWPFDEITALNFNKVGVRGVQGCIATIEYGAGQQLQTTVSNDTDYALEFLTAVRDRLNNSGRYSL